MKYCFLLAFFFLTVNSSSAQQEAPLTVIPEPVSLVRTTGYFTMPRVVMIETGNDPEVRELARQFIPALSHATGFTVILKSGGTATIHLQLTSRTDSRLGDEGYILSVIPAGIMVRANKPAGLFYGMQTLLQLMPPEVESVRAVSLAEWKVPCVEILDYPRFAWRGMMFDVVRHFFTVQQVEQFIDEMVRYKYNLLHLHLTDDQGWRIEIKSLPQLTEFGAWRVPRVGDWAHMSPPEDGEARTYGGYFSQDDIREIIAYAKERYVNVMPEIDVPGHSMAAVATYPELSCTPGDYHVNAGEKFIEWGSNGSFYALTDNTLCPANEKTYEFLDKVFTEVAQLFPFEYIHIGGDECAKNFWEKSDAVKALMKKEKLKNMDEVQSYFEKRVEKIVSSKGKKVIGWDEILEGGLAPGAAVMSWRGMKGGAKAAGMGHKVVMTPTTHCYLDLYQGDPVAEPETYSMVRLQDAYKFDPVPDGVNASLIMGGQANLWTEQVPNFRHLQYMLWPRAFAVAECLWSPKEKKDWDKFISKVETEFKRFDAAQIKYARSMYDPIFKAGKDANGKLKIELSTELKDLTIYYSFDETNPDQFYPQYSSPLSVPKDAVHLKVITYRDGQPIGKQINMPIAELKKRAKIE